MNRDRLRDLVRDALNHLYQEPLLQQHPLAELLVPEVPVAGRGVALRRVLVDTIQQLRPPHTIALVSPVWRRYHSLCQRYLEGKTFKQIAEAETISVRQAVRDHHGAIEALLDALWVAYSRGHEPSRGRNESAPVASSAQPEDAMTLEGELLRFSSGGTGGNRESTRLDEVLADALLVLQPLVSDLRTGVECSVPATLPSVTASRSILRQALLSILSYAVERSSGGKVAIAASMGADGAELWIVASGWREHLGETLEESARLAVGRRLLEVEGGVLEARPGQGGWAGVRLAFPVAPAATVLVVDDNPDLGRLFQRYLVGTNYQVVQAVTGQRALELARELRPIAITLDLMMPSQDGWELLQNLLRGPETRGTPVVVCSVLPGRALALALGASQFLAKPVTRDALLAVLTSCQPSGPGEPPG
jgi:CheY-like chemotaxis protein